MVCLPHRRTRLVRNDIIRPRRNSARQQQSFHCYESERSQPEELLILKMAWVDPSYPKLCLWTNSIGDHSLVAKVLIRATWREKTQLWLYAGCDAQLKVLDFLLRFSSKCGNQEQAGIAEITWPGGGNPQTAVSVIFPHTLAAGEGLSASNHPPQKRLPRNDKLACLPDAMTSALTKTSECPVLSIVKVSHTHRYSIQPALIARESDRSPGWLKTALI